MIASMMKHRMAIPAEATHGDESEPSKTRLKKEMSQLQALGEKLVALPVARLRQMQLPEDLLDALLAAQGIRAHGALRRQLQYIGRLMRDVDAAPIRAQLDALEGTSRAHAAWQHRLEHWRTRLINDDASLEQFVAAHPTADTQRLHTFIRNARREQKLNQPPRAFRELLRLLREYDPAPNAHGASGDDLPSDDT